MKICSKCKTNKYLTEFTKNTRTLDGFNYFCKICSRTISKESYKKHREKRIAYAVNRSHKNLTVKQLKYEKTNEWMKNNKTRRKEYKKNYDKNNREKANKLRKITGKIHRDNNPKHRVNSSISKAIYAALKKGKSGRSWVKLVSYSIQDLINHLESKFTKGMSWENYGRNGWHIDHVIPKYYFKYNNAESKAFKACWALSNLQPLWATAEIAVTYGESSDYIGNLEKCNRIEITPEIKLFLDDVNS